MSADTAPETIMEEGLVPVLVVEDRLDVQQVLGAALEEGGFLVLAALTADQALAALNDQNQPIKALVIDTSCEAD